MPTVETGRYIEIRNPAIARLKTHCAVPGGA
jgi:hypothetical protein